MRTVLSCTFGLAILMASAAPLVAQAPHEASYTPARTPWGDPDLQGTYTNADEFGTPMERPDDLTGHLADYGEKEMAALRAERQRRAQEGAGRIGGSAAEDTGAGPSHWYEHLVASNAQPWLVFEPPSGKIPELTPAAQQRAGGGRGRGGADSWEDRSLYDRCISLGVPGSMTPMIYGNAYDITQGPGFVAIRYEMVHETRIIRLDDGPRVASAIRPYMGDARGHWEGHTLVVETKNINPLTTYRNASENLTITERFIPVDEHTLRWEIRFEDPDTWEQPWAYGMPLRRDAEHAPFEYACHEGNYGLRNILSAARSEEAEAEK